MAIATTNMALAQSNSGSNTTDTPAESSSSAVQVQAGGGNSTLPYTVFSPQNEPSDWSVFNKNLKR